MKYKPDKTITKRNHNQMANIHIDAKFPTLNKQNQGIYGKLHGNIVKSRPSGICTENNKDVV